MDAMLSHIELERQVDGALSECRRRGTRVSLLMLQVTSLELAADGSAPLLATEAAVLDNFVLRLRGRVRQVDRVLRLDERLAAVIQPGAGHLEAEAAERRLARLLAGAYRHDELLLELRLQIGRATYPESGVRGHDLMLAAAHPLRRRTPA